MSVAGRLRIVVLGYVVRGPLGGMVWSNLQYLQGLARLGHDVHFLEDSDDWPSCYDPVRDVTDADPTRGLAFATRAFARIGLGERWAYHDAHTRRWLGPAADRALGACAAADLLLNLCGVNPLRPWLEAVPVRVLVDEDPAFTQIRHLADPAARAAAARHTAFFSFGANVGRPGCAMPDDGLPWVPTRQPVVLDTVPLTPGPPGGRFTTVMQWTSYPPREHGGVRYGMKGEAFAPFLDLPARVGRVLELAAGGGAPARRLRRHGWHVRDPRRPTRDPEAYLRFVRRSRAEWSVAKHGYVAARSGWFSERSVTYLASGRPVVVQDTGFTDWLPAGAGVHAFRTLDEAVAGIEAVMADYPRQCAAAREVAEAWFAADRVLPPLLEAALARGPAAGTGGPAR